MKEIRKGEEGRENDTETRVKLFGDTRRRKAG